MSFIGMGPLEVFLVLLVAFLVMGPQRMIEIAKLFGKALSELRRLNSGLAEVLEDSAEVDTVSSESDKDNKEQADETHHDEYPVAFESSGKNVLVDKSRIEGDGQTKQ